MSVTKTLHCKIIPQQTLIIIFMRYGHVTSGQDSSIINVVPAHIEVEPVRDENRTDTFFNHKQRVYNYTQSIQDDGAKFLIRSFMTFCPNVPLCYDGGQFYHNYSFPFSDGENGLCHRCSCSPSCEKKGDCCISRYLSRGNTILDLDQKVDNAKKPKYSCLSTRMGEVVNSYGNKVIVPTERYWMIANCPEGYPRNNLWRKCKRLLPGEQRKQEEMFTPVISARSNDTYQNKYCAECFGELQIDLFPWKKIILRNVNDDTKAIEKSPFLAAYENRIMIVYIPPLFLNEIITCQQPTISKCNVTTWWKTHDERLLWACETLPHTVIYSTEVDGIYKNIYCVLCNTPEPDLTVRVEDNSDNGRDTHQAISSYSDHILGISSSSMSFEALEILSDYTFDKKCHPDEVYSPILKRCLPIHCNSQYVQKGPKCQLKISNDIFVAFLVSFAICNVDVIVYEIRMELSKRIYEMNTRFKTVFVRIAPPFLTRSNIKCVSVIFTFSLARTENIIVVSNYLTTFLPDLIRRGTNDSNHQIRMNDYGKRIKLHQHEDIFHFGRYKILSVSVSSLYTVAQWQYCPKVDLPENYHLNFSDFEICILEYNVCFESYLAEINEQTDVALCVDLYMEIVNNKTRMLSDTYLQETNFLVVCLSVSSLGCILTFMVLVHTRETVTLQVRMILPLCLFLVMANSLHTVSRFLIPHYPLCLLFGILSHFLWLMVVCWMFISCLELYFQKSTVLKTNSRNKHTVKFLAYFIISLALCAVMVAIHVQISHHVSDGSSVGYSGTTCFLANGLLKIFTLLLPVVLIVFINSFLCVAMCCIKRHRVISNPQHNNLLKLYIKLSTTTGSAWVSYFLHELFDIAFFFHAHILLNGCLGVFIFVLTWNSKSI